MSILSLQKLNRLDQLKFDHYCQTYGQAIYSLSSAEALNLALLAEEDYQSCLKTHDPIAGRMKQRQLDFEAIALLLEKQGY